MAVLFSCSLFSSFFLNFGRFDATVLRCNLHKRCSDEYLDCFGWSELLNAGSLIF